MPPSFETLLEPRKSPVQARSTASVDAILEATVQVLLSVGRGRLTTSKVAERAGVSVGTLYQYFPNKKALLYAALKRHLDEVTEAVERVCAQQRGRPVSEMGTALINAFLEAKMKDPKASVALYSVSADFAGAELARQMAIRSHAAVVGLLASAPEPLGQEVPVVAAMVQGAMAGVSRRLLESADPEKHLEPLRQELIFLVTAYLKAGSARSL